MSAPRTDGAYRTFVSFETFVKCYLIREIGLRPYMYPLIEPIAGLYFNSIFKSATAESTIL